MVLALLTASFVSIVCLIITGVMGFTMSTNAALSQHTLFGFFTTFIVTLSQSMTMFYFIGTGKHVKDLVSKETYGAPFIQRTKVFKAKTFPPAIWAMLFTMATMILGGGVHTRVVPSIIHTALAVAALYFNLVAFWREAKCMIEHNMLMEEVVRLLDRPDSNGGGLSGRTAEGTTATTVSLAGPTPGPTPSPE